MVPYIQEVDVANVSAIQKAPQVTIKGGICSQAFELDSSRTIAPLKKESIEYDCCGDSNVEGACEPTQASSESKEDLTWWCICWPIEATECGGIDVLGWRMPWDILERLFLNHYTIQYQVSLELEMWWVCWNLPILSWGLWKNKRQLTENIMGRKNKRERQRETFINRFVLENRKALFLDSSPPVSKKIFPQFLLYSIQAL